MQPHSFFHSTKLIQWPEKTYKNKILKTQNSALHDASLGIFFS